jgi:VWFA-related protein
MSPKLSTLRSRIIRAGAATLLLATPVCLQAQSTQTELDKSGKTVVSITNLNGRVSVLASDNQKSVSVEATRNGVPVTSNEVQTTVKGGNVDVVVHTRRESERIDLTVRVPSRSRIRVTGEAGAVDIVGNVEFAEVQTNTGTIHADVPLDAVKYSFLWESSRPRYLSDVELPKIKEKAGGRFLLAGSLGEKVSRHDKHKKAPKNGKAAEGDSSSEADPAEVTVDPAAPKLVRLDFRTRRGVILLNVDPSMVPSDLKERPLTEAAKAIVRSGDLVLVEAIRKVSPKLFGDYAKTLPPSGRQPTLTSRPPAVPVVSKVAPQLMRVNASVTDRNGRALSDLIPGDFTVVENGVERKVVSIAPAHEPFNLVLLLDVSGSVEERIDFIRKAARDFLKTASPQDRIAIISFRDDIQIISNFSTNRAFLSQKLEEIDAGGATALYDALGYVLSTTLKPLRGDRTAVVILSDGDDNQSFIPIPALLEATNESGALIYPLYVPSGLIPESSVVKPEGTVDPLRTRYLTLTTRAEEDGRKLANASGGIYYPIHRLEDLQRAYDDVVAQLRTAYTITYASNSDPAQRRVKVRANRDGASVRLSPVVGIATP